MPLLHLYSEIYRLVIESKESARVGYEPDGAVLVATLNLVDLAGSESVKHTGAMGQRAKEGGKINQSLLSLSRVIHALSQPGAHVNFRDSKLTRLLQPSLCGNAKMSIVCCITPADRYLEEVQWILTILPPLCLYRKYTDKLSDEKHATVCISREACDN